MMAVMNVPFQNDAHKANRRRFQRVRVTLFGRYMLESHEEYPCQTIEMSPGDMRLSGPVKAQIGENVVVYLDEIGRFAGVATRRDDEGFSIVMRSSPGKRDKLADQLTWFANRHRLGVADDRRHERIVPLMQRAIVKLPSGVEHLVKILDVSLSGVGVQTDVRPPFGSEIIVGSTPVIVVRHFENGIAGQFRRPLAVNELDETIRL
jgi:hypothetical protein